VAPKRHKGFEVQYYRTAILASHDWPENNRPFQNDLAAIFSHNQCPFSYCHAFTGEGLGYRGSEESVSRRVTRDLWEAKRAAAIVGCKTFDYIPGGGNLKRPTQYVISYLNAAAEFLRNRVETDAESIPFAAKVSKHLSEARKLLPRLQQKSIKRHLRKAGKRAGRNTGGAASTLKDDLNDLSELGLAALKYADEGHFVVPLYSTVDGACDCKAGAECERTGKHPRIKKHIQCASRNKGVIAGWWRRWPNAGVGIATGRMVARGVYLIVIDVDRRRFGHGSLSILADELGEVLPETRTVITADGWHYYCLVESDIAPSSFAFADKGVEIKASSGIVVAPPTARNGHVYHLETETPIAVLSGVLAEWVLTRGRRTKVPITDRHKFLVRCGRALAGKKLSLEEILGTLRARLSCCEVGGRVIAEDELRGIADWAFAVEARESKGAQRVA
jgi:hypothetical protein